MRVPVEWLKEYVPVRPVPEALAQQLTMAGLEVTGIERVNGEPVLDLEITPNRADCLSILGVAREVAVLTGQRLKLPLAEGSGLRARGKTGTPRAQSPEPRARLTIRIEDRQGCARYIGRFIDEVRIGPSPEWMQRRLIACGARPINSIVDITNYVLLEYGQPLHAFDFDRLDHGMVLVRRAQMRESLTTLDGIVRPLSSDMLVIADAKQPIAVAGVMGGQGSEVTLQTRSVLLESAFFDPVTVRRTARKLGLVTESSYRFERGVDPLGVEAASARAAALIQELAGGAERALCDVGSKPLKRTGIILDSERVSRWLGMPLSPTAVRTTLARLSCHVASSSAGTTLHVSPPSFRQDLTQDVDLAEELARLTGYDRIPSRVPTGSITGERAESTAQHERVQSLKRLCARLGLHEAITWSLVSEADLSRCGYAVSRVTRLANPLSQDHAYLRPSLLIGLLEALRHNLTRGASGVHLFEIGSVVTERTEQLRLGLAMSGVWLRDWHVRESCDFFRMKGLLQALVERLCGGALQFTPTSLPWAEPNQGTETRLNGRSIGVAGGLSRTIAQALDLEHDVWCAELAVEALLTSKRPVSAKPTALFPPVKRDLSILVGDSVAFEAVHRIIREVGGNQTTQLELIDRYTGSQVPSGKHSLTFSIEYRDASRTLTAAEVDALHRRIGQALIAQLHAQIR